MEYRSTSDTLAHQVAEQQRRMREFVGRRPIYTVSVAQGPRPADSIDDVTRRIDGPQRAATAAHDARRLVEGHKDDRNGHLTASASAVGVMATQHGQPSAYGQQVGVDHGAGVVQLPHRYAHDGF